MAHTDPKTPRAGTALRAGVLLALAAAACRAGPGTPEPEVDPARFLSGIVATCASAARDVRIRRAGETTWEPAAAGAVFRAGDELRTGPRSRARIALLGGGALDVDESAAVVVDVQPLDGTPGSGTLRTAPRAGGGESRVAVKEGVVRGTLPRPNSLGGSVGIVVRSSDGSAVRIAARPGEEGTRFRLARQEIGTELALLEGAASVNGANGETTLDAGFFAVARGGELGEPAELIASPASLDPAMDARVLLAAGGAVRLRWSEVQGATAYRVQLARDLSFRDVEVADVDRTEYVFRPAAQGAYAWRVAARDVSGGWSEYGPARRLHCEERAPHDLLLKPADGAVVRAAGDAAQVTFGWEPSGETRAYRLVIAPGPDLHVAPLASVGATEPRATAELACPGEYWWGVYADADGEPRPLFTSPRRLSLQRAPEARVDPPRVEVPRAISQWGN